MSRILLVDDDPQVLSDLECMLEIDGIWEVRTASGGEHALAALAAAPADVVLSDLAMPGMDGAALLRRVQENYPAVVRLALCENADDDRARRAIPVAHQFLTKPCQAGALLGRLEALRDLRQLLANERLQALVGSVRQLPARPTIYLSLTGALLDADVTIERVAAIVEQDPSIATKVLQVANSAFFGRYHQTTELRDAVSHVGYTTLHSLVAACEVFGGFGEDASLRDPSAVDAYLCARMARIIGRRTGHDQAFTAALLRDIGALVLDRSDEQMNADDLAPHPTRHLRERNTLGFDHAELGAYLLAIWGLPTSLVRAVLYHAAPYTEPVSGVTTAGVVWLAESLLRDLTLDETRAVEQYAAALGLEDDLADWHAEAAALLLDDGQEESAA